MLGRQAEVGRRRGHALAWRVGVEGLGGSQQPFDQRRQTGSCGWSRSSASRSSRHPERGAIKENGVVMVLRVSKEFLVYQSEQEARALQQLNPARARRGSVWRAVVLSREG
jgi:hypothetical protein